MDRWPVIVERSSEKWWRPHVWLRPRQTGACPSFPSDCRYTPVHSKTAQLNDGSCGHPTCECQPRPEPWKSFLSPLHLYHHSLVLRGAGLRWDTSQLAFGNSVHCDAAQIQSIIYVDKPHTNLPIWLLFILLPCFRDRSPPSTATVNPGGRSQCIHLFASCPVILGNAGRVT